MEAGPLIKLVGIEERGNLCMEIWEEEESLCEEIEERNFCVKVEEKERGSVVVKDEGNLS